MRIGGLTQMNISVFAVDEEKFALVSVAPFSNVIQTNFKL
jgi:hypothetical protein